MMANNYQGLKWMASIATFLLLIAGFVNEWSDYVERHNFERSIHEVSPMGRWDYEMARLVDPATGEIPEGIQMRELAYAASLPKAFSQRDTVQMDFQPVGPFNCGGRTRAFAMDKNNPNVMLAGAVSGGMWRSVDAGQTWQKVTRSLDHHAVSCVVQDPRDGKTNTWYYGAGESVGNSASKSFSAFYRGSGIYKSTDNGVTWSLLPSTAALPQKDSPWDMVFAVEVDPVRLDSDIVYAATQGGIRRSADGGANWEVVLPSIFDTEFTDVHVTSTGVLYAAIASNGGNTRGFWRSVDGFEWINITPQGLPQVHERTVIQSAPSNENIVYFFTGTPSAGENGSTLFKYNYLSGNGSGAGGDWTNLTPGLTSANYDLFGGYCQVLNVKPDDESVVFIGGTNLYRSTNGFADTMQVKRVGGYSIDGDEDYNYFNGGGKHYPDQQNIWFHPNNPNIMISTTDGGVHRTTNCVAPVMQWESLNNGYISSQFYAIGIDQETPDSRVIIGGLQDRGTWWTNESIESNPWQHIRGGDGAFSEVSNGANHYYISTQYANIERLKIDENGNRTEREIVMPKQLGTGGGAGWLFVHPFTLDRVNDNIMYLPYRGEIWRNTNIEATDSIALFSSWRQICSVSGDITAISASESEEGVVYFGTRTGRIFRADSAHNAFSVSPRNLNNGISTSGYVANIAIDPNEADRAIVVISNYNTISLWLTEDGGLSWQPIEGNLRGNPDPGLPEFLYYIGDGPSIRWAEIVPTPKGNIYFVGTSVGLFATDGLNGDSTVWVQQAPEVIGNVVVDMLHYRSSDGWMAIGTHGNGIYAGHVKYITTPEGIEQPVNSIDLSVFPNPVLEKLTINIPAGLHDTSVRLSLYDIHGRVVSDQYLNTVDYKGSFVLDMSNFKTGTYFLSLETKNTRAFKKIIKQQ